MGILLWVVSRRLFVTKISISEIVTYDTTLQMTRLETTRKLKQTGRVTFLLGKFT